MSQRNSGHARIERDCYETPAWVTEALLPHLPPPRAFIWEPACGSGKMSEVLLAAGHVVIGSDISNENDSSADFLGESGDQFSQSYGAFSAIVTNPPYVHAKEFIERALELQREHFGIVAMLLRTDFDHAKSREHLFGGHPAFAKKLVLTKRIKWFEDSSGQPSFNHAWFIWNWKHQGPPIIAYAPCGCP